MATKVLLGVGNPLKGDDGVGPFVARLLADAPGWLAIDCGPMPENFVGRVAALDPPPKLVVLVDAAAMDCEPGALRRVDKEAVEELALSTHSLPLSLLLGRLEQVAEEVVLIGVEPRVVATGEESLSPEVAAAGHRLAGLLREDRYREVERL